MTDGSTLLYRSRENLSGKSCSSCSGSEKNDDLRRKMEREQLLVAERIREGKIKTQNLNQLHGRQKQEPDCTQNIAQ
jgi:hypothetical protein